MTNIYLLTNKSQLNNYVNIKANFQKMRIPLFMIYSNLSCGRRTNPKFVILTDFAERRIETILFSCFL